MTGSGTRSAALTRTLLRCGVAAGPLFLTTATVEGGRRTDYHLAVHPMSSLSLGPRGWVQQANFIVTGKLLLLGAAGLWRSDNRFAAATLATAGTCLILSGVYDTDPVSDYPPGATTPEPSTPHNTVHVASAIPIFLGLPLAQLTDAARAVRTDPARAAYSAGSGAAMLVGFVGATAGFSQQQALRPYGGLLQRMAALSGLGWLGSLCLRPLKASTSA